MRTNYMVFGLGLAIAAFMISLESPETVASSAPPVIDLKPQPVALVDDAPIPSPVKSKKLVITSRPATDHAIREQPVAENIAHADASPRPVEPVPAEAAPRPASEEPVAAASTARTENAAGALVGTFTLIHDHSNGNFENNNPKATCVGELSVFENELRFDAPDEHHRFSANWTEVRDAGSNKFFGSGIGGFHVTITADGKYRNFNLAPQSKDKAEAKQVLDLLKAHASKSGRTK